MIDIMNDKGNIIISSAAITAAKQGRCLEEIIHNAALKIPNLTRALREYEIRTHFEDSSLNGVDHWIQVDKMSILIQDKWKETTTQQEVAQFLTCAERIQVRLPVDNTIYLIWASKKEPTANSRKILLERHASLVCCSVSLEALARCVICQICESLMVDSTPSLQSIVSAVAPISLEPSIHVSTTASTASPDSASTASPATASTASPATASPATASPASAPSSPTVHAMPYDETDIGKRDIQEMKTLIEKIQHQILKKAENYIGMESVPDVIEIWYGLMPRTAADWWNGKFSKIDFTSFMKVLKTLCWSTSRKKLPSRNMFLYVKLRKLSVDFANISHQYEAKCKALHMKKSAWERQLASLKVVADPITDAEFRGGAVNCEDYWQTSYRNLKLTYVPDQNILNAFYSHQCSV